MLTNLTFSRVLPFALSAALMMSAPAALAQGTTTEAAPAAAPVSELPSTTTATYGDWIHRCVNTAGQSADGAEAASESCEIVLTIQVQGQTQPIAQLAVGRLPGQTDLVMTAVLPVNISLPGKVHISGNGKSADDEQGGFDLNWSRCLPVACFAEAKPDEAVLDVMRKEISGALLFTDGSGRNIALPLSWRGFTQALAALK